MQNVVFPILPCRATKQTAPERLFTRHKGDGTELWAIIYTVGLAQAQRQGVPAQDAQDCALDLVCHLMGAKADLTRQRAHESYFLHWLNRCATNSAHNYRASLLRRQRRFSCLDDSRLEIGKKESESAAAPSVVARREFWVSLSEAICLLNPEQRVAFVGVALNGEPVNEVARRLGRSPHAIHMLLQRARRRLRQRLCADGVVPWAG